MKPERKTAMVAGILFILATAFSLASTTATGPILGASSYLVSASTNSNQMILGVLLLLAAAGSIVLIPAEAATTSDDFRKHYDEGYRRSKDGSWTPSKLRGHKKIREKS